MAVPGLSGDWWNVCIRASTRFGVLTALGLLVAAAGATPTFRVVVGDQRLLPKPYPALLLPGAGGSFTDPTFGSKIIRVTDASTAPDGAGVNSAAQDTMFNADTSLFYLIHKDNDGG